MRTTFKTVTILILIVVSFSTLQAQTFREDIEKRFKGQQNLKEGVALIKEGKYKEAIVALDNVIESLKGKMLFETKDKSLSSAYGARGVANYLVGYLGAALNDFDEAVRRDPDSMDAYFGRSLTHLNLGDPDLAFEDAKKVISLNPEVAEAYCVRGSVFLRMRIDPMAENDFEKCFQLNNDLRPYWETEIDRLKRQRSSNNKIEWLSNFNEAYNLAYERQLFLIVWFYQEGPSNKKFEESVPYSPYMASLVPCAIFVRLDITNPQSRPLLEKLGISGKSRVGSNAAYCRKR